MSAAEPEIPPALVDILQQARRVVVLTGAGVSAESGVPTFRDAQTGFWAQYSAAELATPEAFEHNPKLVWEWYAWRRTLVAEAQPNPGHVALAAMERQVPEFTLITQNVDSLHHRAGSRNVIELHGNISRTKCFEQNHPVSEWKETGEVPPRCPQCGGRLRPDVVWFNEMLPADAIRRSIEASQACEVFFSVGTSSQVYPAASLPYDALDAGAIVVEINPAATTLAAKASWALEGRSGEILPALVRKTWI